MRPGWYAYIVGLAVSWLRTHRGKKQILEIVAREGWCQCQRGCWVHFWLLSHGEETRDLCFRTILCLKHFCESLLKGVVNKARKEELKPFWCTIGATDAKVCFILMSDDIYVELQIYSYACVLGIIVIPCLCWCSVCNRWRTIILLNISNYVELTWNVSITLH